MVDYSLIYWVSPKEFHGIGYCNVVKGFINYTLSDLKNISVDSIRCSCKRYKNKKFLNLNVVMIHLLKKKSSWKNTCVGLHTKNHMFLTRPW